MLEEKRRKLLYCGLGETVGARGVESLKKGEIKITENGYVILFLGKRGDYFGVIFSPRDNFSFPLARGDEDLWGCNIPARISPRKNPQGS